MVAQFCEGTKCHWLFTINVSFYVMSFTSIFFNGRGKNKVLPKRGNSPIDHHLFVIFTMSLPSVIPTLSLNYIVGQSLGLFQRDCRENDKNLL